MLRRLFETVVQRCLAEGLIGADGFAVDASLIAADANNHEGLGHVGHDGELAVRLALIGRELREELV